MKIVKYIFLLLFLGAIAVTVFIATQNGTYTVTEEKVISVPRPVLFSYVNEYKNWQNLSLLKGADSTATYNFSQRSFGAGAFMNWEKNGDGGKITTLGITENDSISQETKINGLTSNLSWTFKDTLKSTKITVKLTGKLSFTEKAQALLKGGINSAYEKNLNEGLDNLNAYLVTELQAYEVNVKGLVTKVGAFYLGTTTEGKTEQAATDAPVKFAQLYDFAKQNKIEVKGPPFIIFSKLNKTAKTSRYTYAIQLKEAIYTTAGSEYESGELTGFNALKATLKGDYSHSPKIWKKADEYIIKNKLQENTTAEYVEVYSKNPGNVRKPSQWVTDLYIPIGQPKVKDSLSGPILPPINNTTTQPLPNTAIKPLQNNKPKPATTVTTTASKPLATGTVKQANSTSTIKPATNTGDAKNATTTKVPVTTSKPAANTGTKVPKQTSTTNTTAPAPKKSTTPTAGTATSKPRSTSIRTTTRNNTDDGLNPPKAN